MLQRHFTASKKIFSYHTRMEALYLLIPISLIIVAIAIWIFFKMSENGQFDDMEGDGQRILLDDDQATPPTQE